MDNETSSFEDAVNSSLKPAKGAKDVDLVTNDHKKQAFVHTHAHEHPEYKDGKDKKYTHTHEHIHDHDNHNDHKSDFNHPKMKEVK